MNEYLYNKNDQVTLYKGNSLDVLKTLPDESINCVVTSPPYYGLRDYGSATWIGGDKNCDHTIEVKTEQDFIHTSGKINRVFRGDKTKCLNCKAIRGDEQIGLEATPKEYVENMVKVFKEVKRVLAKDGTVWLNLGDSYSTFDNDGYKEKDLMGIPWKVAFALQDDGWYLRQDIIWHKPAPMPESVTDRCTKSHEYIFLLSKSAKYYYDADAIKEPSVDAESLNGKRVRNPDKFTSEPFSDTRKGFAKIDGGKTYPFRNKRSVWSINTASYKGSHFAVFPKELPTNCIKAGTREGDVVLDPFAGSGTTLMVAQELGRKSIGIDVKEEFLDMCLERTKQMGLF